MAGTGMVAFLFMSIVTIVGGDIPDPSVFLSVIYRVLELTIAFVIFGVLIVLQLMGLIPNPWPWLI
ncbi:MAG: hypothetical protein ISP83_06865 [Candidatus Poseidonia sp.]|nr:hypothetical protein [Poseidonia sp.]MBL6748437.1 hypothetical protein [Poseidonia sp.]MBL6807232.1 hypothetical protein [Poseidonia sp.]MBL6886275.1 hypothetical protein [Poseidonia sp.]MBL6893103.1 hypothetical protein [Poseidonia sp.]